MNRAIIWFWWLAFLWLFVTVGSVRIVFGAADDVQKKKLKPAAISFAKETEELQDRISSQEAITVISSRLPSFPLKLSDIPENVSYIPANVTYKTKSDLDTTPARVLPDSVRDIESGIFYDQVGNGLDTVFSLRGFSEGSAVIVLVDGVRVNQVDGDSVNYPLIPMHDVAFIQIDRGSQSPIYGSGAFAGVMNVITRKPSTKLASLFGGMELSSFKGIKFNQGFSGSVPDHLSPLAGRLTYYFNSGRDLNDGFRDNGEWRITSFDVKIGYELPEDNGGIQVGIKHVEDAISNPGALTIPEYHSDPEQTLNPLDGRKFKNTILQIDANKKFWANRIIASVLASRNLDLIHFFTTSRTFPDGAFNPDTDLVVTRSRAMDFVWQLGYEDVWKWLRNQSQIGMEFRDASENDVQFDAFRGFVDPNSRETDRNAKPHSLALFWRETLKFYDRIMMHAGMRHDFDWLRTRDFTTPTNSLSRRWNDSSISTGLTLKPVSFADLFANYSQGFRVPTISEIAPFASGIATDLKPEKTDSYETGTRLRYKNLAQAKLSFFLIDLRNEILFDETSITLATPFGRNANVGKTRRDGVETRFDVTPRPEVAAYGSYTWMKAYVRETTGTGVPFDGNDLGLIPRQRFTMGGMLKPLYHFGTPFNGLRIGMNGTYTGRQFIQSHESTAQGLKDLTGETIDGYMIWDLILTFEWKGKQIYFKINNLFDRQYYSRAVAATNFGSSITSTGSHLFVNPGAPREFLLGMEWEFGN